MKARRLPVIDDYLDGHEVVVFVDGRVIALSALATAALYAVGAEWTEVSVVAAELVAGFGEPGAGSDPMAMTQITLESLAEQRLVEWD